MSFRRQWKQATFAESLEYDTQLREQIRVYREYSNVGMLEGMTNALDTLFLMVTPDIVDQAFLNVMGKEEDELEKRQLEAKKILDERMVEAISTANIQATLPSSVRLLLHGPDKIYLDGKFQHIIHLFQRSKLLLRQTLRGKF